MPLLFSILLVVSAVARFAPHPANFAPTIALGIFAGLYGNKKQALLLPIAARLTTDLLIGFDTPLVMASIYLATVFGSLLGIWVKDHKNVLNIAGASITGSFAFFILTNLAVWKFTLMYPQTISGLKESFILAIPFFRNTLLGDLFYVTLFVGSYEFVTRVATAKINLKERNISWKQN